MQAGHYAGEEVGHHYLENHFGARQAERPRRIYYAPVHRRRAVDYPHEGRPEYAEDDYRGGGAAEGRHQRHGVGAVYHGRYRAEHLRDGQEYAAQERRHPREEAERHARSERDRHAGAEQHTSHLSEK